MNKKLLPHDCWLNCLEFLDDVKDYKNLMLSIKDLYFYVIKVIGYGCRNIRFITLKKDFLFKSIRKQVYNLCYGYAFTWNGTEKKQAIELINQSDQKKFVDFYPNLTKLFLCYEDRTNENSNPHFSVEILRKIPKLLYLHCENVFFVEKGIENLKISVLRILFENNVKFIRNLPKIKFISFGVLEKGRKLHGNIGDLPIITNLPSLEKLHLCNNVFDIFSYSYFANTKISNLKSLKELKLRGYFGTAAIIKDISSLEILIVIKDYNDLISRISFENIGVSNLKFFDVSKEMISSFNGKKSFSFVDVKNIENIKVTTNSLLFESNEEEFCIDKLSNLPNLRKFFLKNIQINDINLLPNLRKFNVFLGITLLRNGGSFEDLRKFPCLETIEISQGIGLFGGFQDLHFDSFLSLKEIKFKLGKCFIERLWISNMKNLEYLELGMYIRRFSFSNSSKFKKINFLYNVRDEYKYLDWMKAKNCNIEELIFNGIEYSPEKDPLRLYNQKECGEIGDQRNNYLDFFGEIKESLKIIKFKNFVDHRNSIPPEFFLFRKLEELEIGERSKIFQNRISKTPRNLKVLLVDAEIEEVCDLPFLESLIIRNPVELSKTKGLRMISGLPNLKYMDVYVSPSFNHIKDFPSLKELRISRIGKLNFTVYFSNLPKITIFATGFDLQKSRFIFIDKTRKENIIKYFVSNEIIKMNV